MIKDGERIGDPEKVDFVFTGKALEALQEIAEREGKSLDELDEVIESAIGLKQWTHEVKANGERIIVRRGNKDKYELTV